jgi:regulator of ribonuclease activity A
LTTNEEQHVTFKTADLYDANLDAVQVLKPVLRSFGGVQTFSGTAVTVKCFEDNSRVKEATAQPGAGRVLMVDGGGSLRCALLGDLLAAAAVRNGWAGIIIHGCVRDTAALATMQLGVLALAATPRKSERRDEGQRDTVIDLAGVRIHPGDFVYADADGVLVSRHALDLQAPPA